MKKGIPFIAFGNDELRDLPNAYEADGSVPQMRQAASLGKRN